MKGDFTRFTFKPEKNYNSVRMQQGRVQLDADWNEHVEIQSHLDRTESVDVIGACGVPRENGGFKISVEGNDLAISRGRIYVDGILCENDVENRACEYEEPRTCPPVLFSDQPHLPPQTLPSGPGLYLFYLDVWERHVTAVEDPDIRETALGGPDTATRIKTIWQVKYLPVVDKNNLGVDLTCWDMPHEWTQMLGQAKGRMAAGASEDQATQDPCIVAAEGGYRRLENQLYRVEIHASGDAGTATFKWSRDNGIVLTRLLGIATENDRLLTVANPGRDANLEFAPGYWTEVTDDNRILGGEPGVMVRLKNVEGNVLEIESWPPYDGSGTKPALDMGTATVRRWDHKGKGDQDLSASDGALPIETGDWLDLEGGVQVRFDGGGDYNSGDYWLIPARAVGSGVEWPQDEGGSPPGPAPKSLPPYGIQHHHCRLALVAMPLGFVCDARPFFPDLTEPDLYYVSGDGQEAMPDTELPQPLEVGVVNCNRPVKGAWVKFKIAKGGGYLIPDPAATVVVPLAHDSTGERTAFIMPTNDDGRAHCRWHLQNLPPETDKPDQQVEATLLKLPEDRPENKLDVPVVFGASFGVAWQDRYGGTNFPDQQHPSLKVITVEKALDQLRENTALHYVGGNGQEARRDERLPQPLQVRVANGQWPREGATVRFEVELDSLGVGGKLEDPDTGSTGTALTVATDSDGMADVYWALNQDGNPSQHVTATLIDPVQPTAGSQGVIHFSANLSIAEQVTYDPDACEHLSDASSVQDAIDRICHNIALYYVCGGGQEAIPGETLPKPLQVLVANGQWVETGAQVKFQAEAGNGSFQDPLGTDRGAEWEVTTNAEGIASAFWRLDRTGDHSQKVNAVLVDADDNSVGGPVCFNANLSVASQVAYDAPSDCPELAGVDTVKEAIDRLCQPEKAIDVIEVVILRTEKLLINDQDIPVENLDQGIRITCDGKIDPASIGRATCFVALELPAADFGYSLIILRAKTGAAGENIIWNPAFKLESLRDLARGEKKLLARLFLKGNYIWAADSDDPPKVYLDGEVFGRREPGRKKPEGARERLHQSGDGRRGGDLEMWFWLVVNSSPPRVEPIPPGPIPPGPIPPGPIQPGPIPPRVGPVAPPVGPTPRPEVRSLNTATVEELAALPGIGPEKATAIVARRPFASVNDVLGVPGIGPATLERLRPLVTV
ncbi:MAG: DUF6519 domain-containing protein [Planctomycetota bacterium]|jgi:competence ComEA-like helix-hairpin-helix protein